jgi:hypothetical protein
MPAEVLPLNKIKKIFAGGIIIISLIIPKSLLSFPTSRNDGIYATGSCAIKDKSGQQRNQAYRCALNDAKKELADFLYGVEIESIFLSNEMVAENSISTDLDVSMEKRISAKSSGMIIAADIHDSSIQDGIYYVTVKIDKGSINKYYKYKRMLNVLLSEPFFLKIVNNSDFNLNDKSIARIRENFLTMLQQHKIRVSYFDKSGFGSSFIVAINTIFFENKKKLGETVFIEPGNVSFNLSFTGTLKDGEILWCEKRSISGHLDEPIIYDIHHKDEKIGSLSDSLEEIITGQVFCFSNLIQLLEN